MSRHRGSLLVTALTLAAVVSMGMIPSIARAVPLHPASSKPCTPQQLGNCPVPGTYLPGSPSDIYSGGDGLDIYWAWSTVEKPPAGQVPQYLHVNVKYYNSSSQIMYFTCQGWEDPSKAKEWFLRNGTVIGYVAADHTLCSDHPETNFTLGPGRYFVSWARFHNVPWKGDRIAIEWGEFGKGSYVDPYAHRG